ncbi:MAG: sensor histidine kinase [Aquificaceae bacterium]
MRLYVAFALFFIFFLSVNIAFLDNLRNLWNISYPLVLLVINLDLLVLVVVFMIFFRKFIKVYVAGKRAPLRKKLSTSLILYIITPLIFLNLATAILLLQSTKSFVSGQLKEIAKRSEELSYIVQEEERRRVQTYKEAFDLLGVDKFSSLKGVRGVFLESSCQEGVEGSYLVLCIKGYKVLIERGRDVLGYTEDIKRASTELRNMVKARDIIGGIYVYFLVLVGFVSFLSAVWFGNLIARHISLPLERLSQKAKEISKGNFDLLVEVPQTKDEVQELAMSFLTMKEELKKLYGRLKKEKEILSSLLEALPVGIVFLSKEGERLQNRAYEELSKKSSVREFSLDLDIGRVVIYQDLEPIILAERFKTWQMAVKRIAHEIKNPLTPISLNLERLIRRVEKDNIQKEQILQIASLILEELERIKKIIDQFRSLSVEVEPQFKELSLAEIIKQVAKIYTGGVIEVDIKGDIRIVGDERLLRDMFFNLFNNSLEWGAKRVWLDIGEKTMVYRDDGVGIEKGKEELIFLPYHSENPQGMGIGLAVVKHIAELHGWRVKAIAQDGGFYMLFEFKDKKGNT